MFPSGLFSSLQFRLALGFVLALALSLVLIGLATGVVAGQQTQRFERDRDSAQAARVHRFVSDFYATRKGWEQDQATLQELLERAGPVSGTRIQVYDSTHVLVADSHLNLPPARFGKSIKGLRDRRFEASEFPVVDSGVQVGTFTVSNAGIPGPEFQGAVLVAPAPSTISTEVKRSLLWAGIGAAALGILLVWLLSRRTLAPLQGLGATARRLGEGDLSQRAATDGPSEIRDLARNFNIMAEGLEEAERHRRNLTADVAHELRTPLSNIQGYLEAMRDGLVEPTTETIDTIHGQAVHLSRLVEDLRLLAQVEAGALQLSAVTVDLADLLHTSVEAVRLRAESREISVGLDVEDSLPEIEIDPTRISQVIGILLDNAINHTPEGGSVGISCRILDNAIEITASDTGPGISDDDLPLVFERFYRTDPSRDRATGGAGLGLTIARRLVEAHGGTLEVSSEPGEGSTFTVRLPLVSPG